MQSAEEQAVYKNSSVKSEMEEERMNVDNNDNNSSGGAKPSFFRHMNFTFPPERIKILQELVGGDCAHFLSHFYPTPITVDEVDHYSAGDAYSSFKKDFLNLTNQAIGKIAERNPSLVNQATEQLSRPEWNDSVGQCVMFSLNLIKYVQNSDVRQFLASADEEKTEFDNFCGFITICRQKEIWLKIRSNDFPDFLLLGDDLVENVRLLENCSTVCIPEASFIHVEKLAKLVCNLPKIALIVHVGINDLSTKDGHYKHRGINPKMLARRLTGKLAHNVVQKFNITVVLSVTLPRRGSCKLERKSLSFAEKLVVQKNKRSQGDGKIVVFDARSEFQNPQLFEEDGFRLNAAGVQKFEETLNQALHCLKTGEKSRFLL